MWCRESCGEGHENEVVSLRRGRGGMVRSEGKEGPGEEEG